jgi:hypothetical protein
MPAGIVAFTIASTIGLLASELVEGLPERTGEMVLRLLVIVGVPQMLGAVAGIFLGRRRKVLGLLAAAIVAGGAGFGLLWLLLAYEAQRSPEPRCGLAAMGAMVSLGFYTLVNGAIAALIAPIGRAIAERVSPE